MNANSNVVQLFPSNNSAAAFKDGKGPVRFDKLYPGSTFRIFAEPSRRIYKSNDKRVYRKDLVGFFSTNIEDAEQSIVLMPFDLVMPVIRNNGTIPRNAVRFSKDGLKRAVA